MTRKYSLIIILLFALFVPACKKDKEKTISVKGKVINETTSIAIQGVYVTIDNSISIGWHTVASTMTNTEGTFELNYVVSDNGLYILNINTSPNYNDKLSNYWIDLKPGDNIDRIFYLYSFADLSVSTSTDQPLTTNDTLWFSIPGIGCRSTTTHPCDNLFTNSAKANKKNLVDWTISRNGNRSNFQDSVYCKLDSTTYYTIVY